MDPGVLSDPGVLVGSGEVLVRSGCGSFGRIRKLWLELDPRVLVGSGSGSFGRLREVLVGSGSGSYGRIRIRQLWQDPDPYVGKRSVSDPYFKKVLDPVWTSRFKILIGLNFSCKMICYNMS